jgi:nucleotide-binding universal stress UspA family protein
MDTIVVGVDGSEHAHAALVFAVDEAAMRGAQLRVVAAWDLAPAVYSGGFTPGFDQETVDAFRDTAATVVREALAEATRLKPELDLEGRTREGQAAEVLLAEASDALLLVVGNRGRGGFTSLLLGSVSQQLVLHSPCPVLVVRTAEHH